MRYAYDKSTTRIVSCKSNLQLACDCRVRHEECRGLLKHVLKPYDNRSDRQFYIVEIVYDFSMTRAARATKIACDNRKQKSYRVNRLKLSSQNGKKKKKQATYIDFLKTGRNNLESWASIFPVASHFHPGHLQPKTLVNSFRSLIQSTLS